MPHRAVLTLRRCLSAAGALAARPVAWLRAAAARLAALTGQLPGGARLWVGLASFGFVLAALAANLRALLQLSLDSQGWWWLLLAVGVSLLSLVANGLAWGVGLRWLGLRPRWRATVLLFLASNLRKYLPGGIWHLVARLRALQSSGQDGPAAGDPLPAPLATGQALVAVLLDPLLMAVAALALLPLGGWQAGLGPLGVLPLLALAPRWLAPLLDRLERRRAAQLQRRGLLEPGQIPSPSCGCPATPCCRCWRSWPSCCCASPASPAACRPLMWPSPSPGAAGWPASPSPGPLAWWCQVPPVASGCSRRCCCCGWGCRCRRRPCWRWPSATAW